MGVKLFERTNIPFAFYNTWRPFYTKISDTLIRQLADGMSGTGTDLFIIDDGWQNRHGDWEAHPKKFPNGMKAVCDYIIEKGKKPGLWMSLATVNDQSRVFKEHPEWAIKGKDGKPSYMHVQGDPHHFTMSLATGYADWILEKMKKLVRENRLAYLKLDFAIINSAYVLDYDHKGDWGAKKGSPDRASSYYAAYENALRIFDSLHAAFPELLIDCTYEVWGEYYINDFALIQHADYDWLTNYNDDPPLGPINIRQMCYDRARVIPAATNLIGNQLINTDYSRYTFLSLASGKPILVGDARELTPELKAWYAKWNAWFKMMDEKFQFTRFSQTSDVFPRAQIGNWDGCYKFNPEKDGGVLFFYRNGSLDATRTFAMPLVKADHRYRLYDPEAGAAFGEFSGKELLEKGITIHIPNQYEAKVLGIISL
jgi:alpha-galactosidase